MRIRPLLLCVLALAAVTTSAERAISSFEGFTAYVADDTSCAKKIAVQVRSANAADFSAKKSDLKRLVAGLGVSLADACDALKSVTITGHSGASTYYHGIAALGTDWQLVDQVSTDIFAAPKKAQSQAVSEPAVAAMPAKSAPTEDPFALFQQAQPAQPAQTAQTAQTAQSSGSGVPAAAPKSAPAQRPSTVTNADTISVFCSGKAQQYTGPMPTFSETFEFRTILKPSENKHTVVSVLKGKIMRDGATYDLLKLPNDVMVLSAESTEPKWIISTVKLDLAVGRLSGEGSVNLTGLRSRINSRLGQSGGSSSIPEGGLDSSRRVELQGTCVNA